MQPRIQYGEPFFTRTQEPYSLLLERPEWNLKRLRILTRDHYTCQRCGVHDGPEVRLHVHHKHYICDHDPWEYRDSELVTLCDKCHSRLHATTHVPVYHLIGNELKEIRYTPCRRCGGAGWFLQWKHVQGGVCFRCRGAKYDELMVTVKNYLEEHDIDLDSLSEGFLALAPELGENDAIKEVAVKTSPKTGGLYAEMQLADGRIYYACLDISVKAASGDKLVACTLKYKYGTKKNGEKYLIIKGDVIRP